MRVFFLVLSSLLCMSGVATGQSLGPLPPNARVALTENWASGAIDPTKWYSPYKKWGQGNNGVTPQNVRIASDLVGGQQQNVLVLRAHGDEYDGPIVGHNNQTSRVGAMLISKEFFASGRYEVVMKIGGTAPTPGGPTNPMRPVGAVPAIWTYAYRYLEVPVAQKDQFVPTTPLYNPHMQVYGVGANEYWSELDFPEFGKGGNFDTGLYNTFLQNRHQSRTFDVSDVIDGEYHTLTTEWRTHLVPLAGVTDSQVIESEGYWWVQDKSIPFNSYVGNPLKRLGPNQYAVYAGQRADHWIDGKFVGTNPTWVPSMAAQLTMGIWLPQWAGPAPWETATASIASVKVWQYDDVGDVRGILTSDIEDNYAPSVVAGDLNGDARIDLEDWVVFKANFGLDTSGISNAQQIRFGDFDKDGRIQMSDFIQFRTLYEDSNGIGSLASALARVPEPNSTVLLVAGTLTALCTCYRRSDKAGRSRRIQPTSSIHRNG